MERHAVGACLNNQLQLKYKTKSLHNSNNFDKFRMDVNSNKAMTYLYLYEAPD